jgi:hypothetical protein
MNAFSNKPFKSVEHWKSAIMSLPENNFFELLRSIFGNIKTPFNKQRLLDDLFALLSKKEIRNTIAAYINGQDHKIIAATALLNSPAPKDLVAFFAGEFSYAELHSAIINLEERLILYRFQDSLSEYRNGFKRIHAQDENFMRLALNPVLENVLAPFIADISPLFPSLAMDSSPKERKSLKPGKNSPAPLGRSLCFSDNRIMPAFFAFILDEDELFKETTLTEIRKKVLDKGKKNFQWLDFENAVLTLIQLCLFRQEGRNFIANREKINQFTSLSPAEREEYWAAGVYLCLYEPDIEHQSGDLPKADEHLSFRFSWNRLRKIAQLIHNYRILLYPDRRYPEVTLKRLGKLLGEETISPVKFWDHLPTVMEKTG